MLIPVVSIGALGGVLGVGLAFAARHFKVEGNPLVEEVAAMMPNSQCGLCGQASCSVAAEKMVSGEIALTNCVPGGKVLAQRIAEKLGVPLELDGFEEVTPQVAIVDELICTGCSRCLKACGNDAIIGAAKHIHGVLNDLCSGCGKCVDLCPTMAIGMVEVPVTLKSWRWQKPRLEEGART